MFRYNFNLQARYKALTAEEAEVAFEKRDKIRNFSLVMNHMKSMKSESTDSDPSRGSGSRKNRSGFRVTDEDDDFGGDDSDASGGGGSDNEENGRGKSKNKKNGSKKNKKKRKDDDDNDYDSDPAEESDGKQWTLIAKRMTLTFVPVVFVLIVWQRVTSISEKWITFLTRPHQRRMRKAETKKRNLMT
jgi:transcription initiation factor TFIIF subunit alpha